MLKINETAIATCPKVKWNPRDDKLYGFCYEHGRDKQLVFESVEQVLALNNSDLHIPKDNMVIALSYNSGVPMETLRPERTQGYCQGS